MNLACAVFCAYAPVINEAPGLQLQPPADVFHVAVVVEEIVVLHNFKRYGNGVALLLGIIYAVNLQCPSAMKYVFVSATCGSENTTRQRLSSSPQLPKQAAGKAPSWLTS